MVQEVTEGKVFRFMRASGQLDILGVGDDQLDKVIEAVVEGQNKIDQAASKELGLPENDNNIDVMKMMANKIWPKKTLAKLITFMAEYYEGQYTEHELDALIDFYESDVGQRHKMVSREAMLVVTAKISETLAENLPSIISDITDSLD